MRCDAMCDEAAAGSIRADDAMRDEAAAGSIRAGDAMQCAAMRCVTKQPPIRFGPAMRCDCRTAVVVDEHQREVTL